MKLRLTGVFLFALLLMAYGCGGGSDSASSSNSKIHGTWTIDIEKTADSSEQLKAQLGADPAAGEMLKAMLGDSTIIIDAEKGTIGGKMVGVELPQEKFTILSEEGDVVKIKHDSGEEMALTIVDADTISLDDPSGIKLILVRK